MVVRRRIQGVERRADRGREIRLAARRGLRRGALEGGTQECMVRRKRTQQHAGAAKRHKRAAVAFKGVDKVGDIGLGAFKPVWAHIRDKHRARHVESHDHVAAARLELLGGMAPLRTSRRQCDQGQTDDHERHLQSREPAGSGRQQTPRQRRGDDLLETAFGPGTEENPERTGQRNQRHQYEHPWADKFHG